MGYHHRHHQLVNWLNLPEDIWTLVADKLINFTIKDYIRFGAVCRLWHSVYVENLHRLPRRKLPMLMLPTQLNLRSFYSLTEKKLTNSQVKLSHNLLCRGSNHGWLLTVCRTSNQVRLFNPFFMSVDDNSIQLPSLTTFECDHNFGAFDFVFKVVLSANPALNPNYKAMAIYGALRKLAYFMPGDNIWTTLQSSRLIEDVIYYRDQFYAIHIYATDRELRQVTAWDINHVPPKVSKVGPPLHMSGFVRTYLVESSGNLLQVLKSPENNPKFTVFKLDSSGYDKWIKMDNLQGCALFVGDSGSFSVSASDYPGCKPNSVYYTDDQYFDHDYEQSEPHSMGVFSFEDLTAEPFYPTKLKMAVPLPIWVEPTL